MSVRARAIHSNSIVCKRPSAVCWLADAAVRALMEEANLTPKPGLVDARDCGAHPDMNLATLYRSACSLRATFAAILEGPKGAVALEEYLQNRNALIKTNRGPLLGSFAGKYDVDEASARIK